MKRKRRTFSREYKLDDERLQEPFFKNPCDNAN